MRRVRDRADGFGHSEADDAVRLAALNRDTERRHLLAPTEGPPTLADLAGIHGPKWLGSRAALGTPYTAEHGCMACGGRVFLVGSGRCPTCHPGDVYRPLADGPLSETQIKKICSAAGDRGPRRVVR